MSKSNIIYKVSPPPFCQSRPLANPLKRAPLIVRMGEYKYDNYNDPSVVSITWRGQCTIFYNLWDLAVSSWGCTTLQSGIADERWSLLKLNDLKSSKILNDIADSKKGPFLKFYLFNLKQLQKAITIYPTIIYQQPYNIKTHILERWKQMAINLCDSLNGIEKKIKSETQ